MPSRFKHKQASLLWIGVFLFSLGIGLTTWLIFQTQIEKQRRQEQYNIIALMQKSYSKESLKTAYLAELLGLSCDQPTNIFDFSLLEG